MTTFRYFDEETLEPVGPGFGMESLARDWCKRNVPFDDVPRLRLFAGDGKVWESVGDVAESCMGTRGDGR
jgi:hypothetical protein